MPKPKRLPPRPSRYELPDVVSTLSNTAAFQGEPSPLPQGNFSAMAGFRVAGVGLAEAHGIIRWGPAPSQNIGFIVGHYNPAKDEWRIFPECVPNEYQARALAVEMQHILPKARRAVLAEARQSGGSFVDLHAPATQSARQELEQLLAPLNPMEFVQGDAVREALGHGDLLHNQEGSSVIGVDSATFCYPALGIHKVGHEYIEYVGAGDSITTSEVEFRPDALLTLCYAGLIVQSRNRRGHTRVIRHVPIAHGDPDLGWIANADTVTPEQWDILQSVPGALVEMSHDIPRFSPLYCSVAYGQPDPDTLQARS